MRLTLRTMLAYMDEILEPDDADDIGKKIEESELAKTVMHRTRDAMRRMRLGAPPVNGRGMALDGNTVAEYLDNTLPAEQVPDFERICLESEVHLAEVGASHQILTLVLGEPAEVDPASRERMYHLISEASSTLPSAGSPAVVLSPPIEAPPVAGAADGAVRNLAVKRSKPEVPDYLREPGRRRRKVLALAAALLLLIGGGIALVTLVPQIHDRVVALWQADMPDDPMAASGGMMGHPVVAKPENRDADDESEPDAGGRPDTESADGPAGGKNARQARRAAEDGSPAANGQSAAGPGTNLALPRAPLDDEGPSAPDPAMTTDVRCALNLWSKAPTCLGLRSRSMRMCLRPTGRGRPIQRRPTPRTIRLATRWAGISTSKTCCCVSIAAPIFGAGCRRWPRFRPAIA